MGIENVAKEQKSTAAIPSLIALSEIDTMCSDLYLQRAKDLLHEELPFETYRGLLRMEGELNAFPNRIQNAMTQGKWVAVKDMTVEMQSMKQSADQCGELLALAKTLYEEQDVPIDPFSPGMLTIAGKPKKDLAALRDQGLALLGSLTKSDDGWADFYNKRRQEFETENPLKGMDLPATSAGPASPERLQQEAQEALEKGNFNKLREVADALAAGGKGGAVEGASRHIDIKTVERARRLDFTFPGATLERARELGLSPFKVESRLAEYAQLAPFVWHPTYPDLESEQGRELRLSALPLPAGTPEALRTRVEMFVLHPFVNSAGIRYLPPLVEEDALVEDFEEPAAEGAVPASPLLEALGLKRRNALSRLRIEAALAEHGLRVVKEMLGLDPFQFRLVCIPCDLHLRIGEGRGWGTQEIWTHFDGYMLAAGGKVHALAGGDVRFGGIYDLVGISRNYEADRIIARFAVVQRRRMARLRI